VRVFITREHVYRSLSLTWSLFIRLSLSHCRATAVHATVFNLTNGKTGSPSFCLSLCCCTHLQHRASVKCFVSLQSLNHKTVGRTPWTGISPLQDRYLHRTTQIQNERRQIDIHALSVIRTHDHSVRASEDSSYLRPRDHYDRRIIYYACISQQNVHIYVHSICSAVSTDTI
jgi:hypothetical protein